MADEQSIVALPALKVVIPADDDSVQSPSNNVQTDSSALTTPDTPGTSQSLTSSPQPSLKRPLSPNPQPMSSATAPAEKKRKPNLTAEEKAEKEQEKARREEKARLNHEASVAKKEAKRLEQEKKNAEKLRRDEEKQRKAEEKQRKVEEKKAMAEKKAKAQPKMTSFFGGPVSTTVAAASPSKPAKKAIGSWYKPFEVKEGVRMAPPQHGLPVSREERDQLSEVIDGFLASEAKPTIETLRLELPRASAKRGFQVLPLREVVSGPVQMKFIENWRDCRPAYCGTFTKRASLDRSRRIARNPCVERLDAVDYEYESEAEWEHEEEGEDIEDEDEVEDDGDPMELDDFLDDSAAMETGKGKKLITQDLEPISSGIQWQASSGAMIPADANCPAADFDLYEIQFFVDTKSLPFNPLSTEYWEPEPVPIEPMGVMRPPPPRKPKVGTAATSTGSKKSQSLIPVEAMVDFKAAIDGSDLTKIALIEHLKKNFPKLKKGSIIATLGAVAERVGTKEAEKKWRLL